MNRLVFIRLLYQQGIEQSRLPEPLKATAILSLHDASELFLALAADKLGASVQRGVQFMDYFKLLSPQRLAGGVELSGRQGMERLNDLRVALKHRGTLPGSAAVAQSCNDTRSFLEDNVQLVFGLAFADIDMAEVIPQADVRDKVKAASTAAATSDLTEAMGLLAEAYDDLFRIAGPQPSPVSRAFGDTFRPYVRPPRIGDVSFDNQLAQITKAVREMQQGLRVMALGIDYWQFVRYQQLTPMIMYFLGGRAERRYPRDYAPTADEFAFCRQFIITVALRIAEAESHVATPSEGTA
jgi:hypothetical protein